VTTMLRLGDLLEYRTGYDLAVPWSRVVVVRADQSTRMFGILPHTTAYIKNYAPKFPGDFAIAWMKEDSILADYVVKEHEK